jgi:O-methyltransferase
VPPVTPDAADKATETVTRELYLDLLKRSLTGALEQDNDVILGGVRTQGMRDWKKRAANTVGKLAGKLDLEVSYKKAYDPALREVGQDWPSRAVSMVGLKRMQNIQDCITAIETDGVPGDFIETGVWRGGSCIFMRGNLKAWGDTTRKVWVADSFEGLPAPNEKDFPADAGQVFHEQKGLSVGEQVVRNNFERYGLYDDQVVFLKGWFKDTLPTAPIEQLSLIRLDGDLYESTIQALEALYPKLAPGGFCIVDDWILVDQAQQACHDYRKAHGITEEVIEIDGTGAYWRKAL